MTATLKVEILLAPEQDTAERSWQAAAAALREEAQQELVGQAATRVVAHDSSILGGLVHGDETAAAPAYVILLELEVQGDNDLEAALVSVRRALEKQTWIDPERSTVVVGAEHVVVPGDQPLMLAMALTRRRTMTRPEFQQYWSTTHAALGRQVPGSEGYRQVHANERSTVRAKDVLGLRGSDFDGLALAYYSSRDALAGIMSNPQVVQPLLEDERRFIDHAHAAMVIGYSPEDSAVEHNA